MTGRLLTWQCVICCCRTVSWLWVQPGTRVLSKSSWTASLRVADTSTTTASSIWWEDALYSRSLLKALSHLPRLVQTFWFFSLIQTKTINVKAPEDPRLERTANLGLTKRGGLCPDQIEPFCSLFLVWRQTNSPYMGQMKVVRNNSIQRWCVTGVWFLLVCFYWRFARHHFTKSLASAWCKTW